MLANGDTRWAGFYIVATSIGLAIFSTVTAGIAIAETTLTVNILAYDTLPPFLPSFHSSLTEYEISNSATTLTLSLITLIHSLTDIFLFKKSHLNPVYTVSLYSIIFTFWLVQTSWELVEVVYADNGSYYDHYAGIFGCSIGDTQYYPLAEGFDVKCPLPKGRFGVSWLIV